MANLKIPTITAKAYSNLDNLHGWVAQAVNLGALGRRSGAEFGCLWHLLSD